MEVQALRNSLRRAKVRPLPAEIVDTQDAVVPAGIQPPESTGVKIDRTGVGQSRLKGRKSVRCVGWFYRFRVSRRLAGVSIKPSPTSGFRASRIVFRPGTRDASSARDRRDPIASQGCERSESRRITTGVAPVTSRR